MNASNNLSAGIASGFNAAKSKRAESILPAPACGSLKWATSILLMLGILLLAVSHAPAQTVRRITAPGKFYVDDKAGAGIVYNYAVYAISNSTPSNIPSAYVVLTNLVATNMISLATNDSGIRALGALASGETKLAAFFLKGPSFTGNSDTILNANEPHTIQVRTAPPGFGTTLISSNFSFTNIIYVIEALANKVTIITNLNPLAVLGSDVDLVIGGETGTIGGNNSVAFSPGVLGSWRPDAYELVKSVVRFTENGNFTNQMYFDPTISGFTNYTGQVYTNTFTFRAVKVTGTNLPVSPFAFVDSGSGTKHTAVSTLTSGGGSNLIYSATNAVRIISQTVSPTSLFAPGGTVTYTITFTNESTSFLNLDEIRDTLPGFPGTVTYITGSATYNSAAISDPGISGQLLRWTQPFALPGGSGGTLVFQALAPVQDGSYTNSVIGIIGNDQIDTTIITTDGNPSTSVFTVIPVADVSVSKSAPASVYSGANFNYTITLTNLGPSYARNFSITDSLPASVTFVSATPPAVTNGNQVIWTNLGPILAGTSTNLIITVTPPVVAASLTNAASGSSPVLDPNSTNNTSPPVITLVSPAADLRITKTPSTLSVLPGANVTYSINVTNLGASLASSVVVTDGLPANVSFVSATGGGVLNGNNVIWSSLGDFAAGTGTSLNLTVTAPLIGSISNIATTASSTFDTNTANNVTPPIVTLVSNLPPSLVNDIASTPRNTAVAVPVLVNDSDPNGNPLTLLSVTQTNGTATVTSGTNVNYTPSTNFMGTTILTYRVTDGLGATNSALITISVTNRLPVAVNDSTPGTNSVPQVINPLVNDSDPDGDSLTISNVVATGGIVTINPGATNITYTPTNSFSSSITYTIADGFGGTATAIISVIGNNVAPVANNQSVTVLEDTSTNLVVSATDIDNANLVYAILTGPSHGTLGTLNTNTGAVTYSPSNNYAGPDSFTFTAFDGSLYATGTVSITVSPVNDPPVLADDNATMNEDGTNAVPVLINDSDADGDTLTIVSVTSTNGTAAINGTNVLYTPATNFFGTNVMTYCATDGTVTNCALITVVVNPVNDAPVADNQSITINEDSSTNLVLTASDVDSTNLTFSIVSGPSSGSLGTLNTNTGAATYTPNPDYAGTDGFTFRVFDGSLYATGTVSITVTPVNDAPLASSQSVTNLEDTALPITLTGSDVDGPMTNFVLVTLPLHGSLSGSGANQTYTPTNNYFGPDSFTFTVNDGSLTSAVATVSITVLPVNDAPVAGDDSYSTFKNVALNVSDPGVLANDTDVENDTLATLLVANVAHGTLSLSTNGGFTYTPSNNYVGPDSFTYRASDSVSNSAVATVSLTVLATNIAPVVVSDSATMNEDGTNTIPVLVNDSDADNDPLTVVSVTSTNGSATIVGTNVVYTPAANFFGTNVMTYCVTDGALTNCATITVVVLTVNDAPLANSQSVTNLEDTAQPITLIGSDVDGPVTNFVLVSLPAHGTLSGSGANLTYTPTNNYYGPDSFTFTVNDGSLTSAVATVSITVLPVNDAPLAVNDIYGTLKNVPLNVSTPGVLANDSDAEDSLTAVLATNVTHGTLILNPNGGFTYTPSTNYVGPDSFAYRASDGTTNALAFVTLTISATNVAPVAFNDSLTVNEDSTNSIPALLNDTDADGDPLAIVSISSTNGTATINGTNAVYTPASNFNGTNVITYCVSDGFLTNCATITVVVLPVNDAPTANNLGVSLIEDTSTNLVLTGSDVDSAPLVFAILANPAHGALGAVNTNTGAITYSPSNSYNGPDVFTFTVFDGSLYATGTVSITVSPVNDTPVATGDSYSTPANVALVVAAGGVLTNDTDVDGDALTAVLVANPLHGTLSFSTNGGFTYTPTNDYSGSDSFTYRANDGTTNSSLTTVALNVTPLADLAVTKTGPTNVTPGLGFSYIIAVTNFGPTTASNIVVVDSLPTNLTFVSATAGGSNASFTVVWPAIGALPKNAGTNFTITVIAPTNGSFINIAYATAATADPNPSNNDGSALASRVSTAVVPVQFGVRQGTNVFNPQTGLYEQLVSVTNLSGSTVAAIQVLVGNFASTNGAPRTNVWLWNATGTNFDGRRYVQYNSPLDPGSNATVRLEFYNPTRVPFTNSVEVLATLPTAAVTNLSGGVMVDRTFWDYRAAGDSRLVIEWTSIIGRNYTVIYGPTVNGPWTAATPTVTATATRTQWYDDGPPKTASKPESASTRYYRVILNP